MWFDLRKDVVSFDELVNIFDRNISEDVSFNLNKVLASNKLGVNDKKYIFYIVEFLSNNFNGLKDVDDKELNTFIEFCLSEEIINKIGTFNLLYCICEKIHKMKEQDNFSLEAIELLKRKINVIAKVGKSISSIKNNLYLDILLKILNSNMSCSYNYDFLIELFANDKLRNNQEKLNMLFLFVLNNEIRDYRKGNSNSEIIKGYKEYSVWDVLASEAMLDADSDKYRKLMIMSLTKEKVYNDILASVMDSVRLNSAKKKLLVDYLYFMMDKGLKTHYCYSRDVDGEDINIYSVVLEIAIISLGVEDYKNTLKAIMESNKPSSYVKVLADDSLSDDKKLFALDMINQGEAGIGDNEKINDYKESVALAAISPVLVNASIDDYVKILSIVNDCCVMTEDLRREMMVDKSKKIDSRIVGDTLAKEIVRLLNCSNIYSNNMPRLYATIDRLIEIGDKGSLIKEMVDFACDMASSYYTDEEYFRVFSMMEAVYEKASVYNKKRLMKFCFDPMSSYYSDKQFLEIFNMLEKLSGIDGVRILKNLFINLNVSFMEDKGILFVLAEYGDLLVIDKITKKLNEDGNYWLNISRVYGSVEEDTLELVMGAGFSRIKRLTNGFRIDC